MVSHDGMYLEYPSVANSRFRNKSIASSNSKSVTTDPKLAQCFFGRLPQSAARLSHGMQYLACPLAALKCTAAPQHTWVSPEYPRQSDVHHGHGCVVYPAQRVPDLVLTTFALVPSPSDVAWRSMPCACQLFGNSIQGLQRKHFHRTEPPMYCLSEHPFNYKAPMTKNKEQT